jgi:hypothetical protein
LRIMLLGQAGFGPSPHFREETMRTCTFVCTAVGALLAAAADNLRGGPGKETEPDRVRRLIEQLGDTRFAKREAASKELSAIGEPALPALRKAAASADDGERRRRAEQLIRLLAERAARRELAKWEGSWETADGVWMKFNGDQWSSGTPTFGPVSGTIQMIEVREKIVLANLIVEAGPTKGGLVLAIFRLEGDRFDYCGTYTGARPTEFKNGGNYYHASFKRGKK